MLAQINIYGRYRIANYSRILRSLSAAELRCLFRSIDVKGTTDPSWFTVLFTMYHVLDLGSLVYKQWYKADLWIPSLVMEIFLVSFATSYVNVITPEITFGMVDTAGSSIIIFDDFFGRHRVSRKIFPTLIITRYQTAAVNKPALLSSTCDVVY